MNIKEECYQLREEIKKVGDKVKELHKHDFFESQITETDQTEELETRNEMHANIQLAYRHLEDARMRIGKTVQAFDGGESVYPR